MYFQGVGVHSGKKVSARIILDTSLLGVWFKRTDLENGKNMIKAHVSNVSNTDFCTIITNEYGASISTIEHALSALSSANIWNAVIEVDGPEMPILDGSAYPFFEKLSVVSSTVEPIYISRAFEVTHGSSFVRLEPADARYFDVTLDVRGFTQHAAFRAGVDDYKDIAKARTFGFFEDKEILHAKGLALGADLSNTCVIKDGRPMNPSSIDDECAKHKILDAIGDLSLAERPIIGAFTACNPGHGLNIALVKQCLEDD